MTLARVWGALAALGVGTALGEAATFPLLAIAICLAVGAACLRRRSALRVAAAACALLSLGAVSTSARAGDDTKLHALARAVSNCRFEGRVLEGVGAIGTLISLETARCDRGGAVVDLGAVITREIDGDAGSSIEGVGWILPLGANPYDDAARRSGALARLDVVDATVMRPRAVPYELAARYRRALGDAVRAVGGREAELLLGLTIGDTSGFDEPTSDRFRRAGLSHLVAVSGSNVAIVLGGLGLLIRRCSLRLRVTASLMALGAFVLVVGPEPSVLRAGAMGALGLTALAFGRRAEPLHALGLALIAVIALRPGMVWSVGLRLSAAATAGIILWGPAIADRLGFLPKLFAVPIAATLSAQACVAPILISTFGEISLVGPVANVLAAPAVAPATIFGLTAGVGEWTGGLGEPLARCAAPFARWTLGVASSLGDRSWAVAALPRGLGPVLLLPVVVFCVRSAGRADRV